MNQEKFENIVDNREARCRDTLHYKGEIYATHNDRLHNFNDVGAMNNVSPQEALWGMVSKHIIATKDMAKSEELPTEKWITEYLGDIHNYMYLLEAIWEDIREAEEHEALMDAR